jgi:hypothetical protein
VDGAREREGGLVGHRQHEHRVRRGTRGAHREAGDRAVGVADEPPPLRPIDRRQLTCGPLVAVPARHRRHHRGDDGVGRQVCLGHRQERGRIRGDLDVMGHAAARYRCDSGHLTPISWAA